MRLIPSLCVLFAFSSLALAQASSPKPPCSYSGDLLRDGLGNPVLYASDEMKARATHKVDLVGFIKQLDFKSTMIVDVLVSKTGDVVCTKSMIGIPLARKPVEEALRSWKFRPAKLDGKPVAYLGRMEFTLCNTSCSEGDYGVTLLK